MALVVSCSNQITTEDVNKSDTWTTHWMTKSATNRHRNANEFQSSVHYKLFAPFSNNKTLWYHHALNRFYSIIKPSGHLNHWCLCLAEFNFDIQKKGNWQPITLRHFLAQYLDLQPSFTTMTKFYYFILSTKASWTSHRRQSHRINKDFPNPQHTTTTSWNHNTRH